MNLTDEEKAAQFDEQWAQVMSGLDRAVAWVKEHKPYLRHGFSFYLNRETGIEISFPFEGGEREEILRLFRGKTAERRVTSEYTQFKVCDAGLTFKWTEYHYPPRPAPEISTVTI